MTLADPPSVTTVTARFLLDVAALAPLAGLSGQSMLQPMSEPWPSAHRAAWANSKNRSRT
eukprot:CAMPEP_0171070154 /NCGR_PEP_ID=MMETSP0766_2-20121228/9576_1 /TAXON_ID=439317 /ORGANISM="Gambierdiscus australes, Strain CAWD 149" /LENGTH=59 /DNA_ID=CAMNT_0011526597 /DNA_START=538 /DNA_END=714 /DNA_ORIENTATION=+